MGCRRTTAWIARCNVSCEVGCAAKSRPLAPSAPRLVRRSRHAVFTIGLVHEDVSKSRLRAGLQLQPYLSITPQFLGIPQVR